MNKKMKDILWKVFALVLVVVVAVWFLMDDMEPIEDTNGPDDISLTTITDENIINLDMGALNAIKVSESDLQVGGLDLDPIVDFSSEDFSGVYEVLYNHFIGNSDVVIELDYLKVDSGNFKMVVLLDGEIVTTIEPSDEPISFRMEDVNGTVSLRIAGESASYSFAMSKTDYELFEHN